MQVGEQAVNVARNAVLAAGWPDTVPGTTIDRQCGSSQQAAHFAAQGVIAGAYDVVVAGGVEVMTRVPMGASMADGKFGYPFGPRLSARYADQGGIVPQGISAELIADKWGITREAMDAFGLRSQRLALEAAGEGRFDREIVAVLGADGRSMSDDEGFRETTPDSLARLKPAFRSEEDGGRVTAGNSSQISDGASAVLVMSEQRAGELGLTPRARFVSFAVTGGDPRLMLTATIPATARVLERAGLALDDVDVVEINEAFASAVLAWAEEHPSRHGTRQRQRWRDRARASLGGVGHAPDDDAAVRARAQRRPLRTADDVRRGRDGQRHRHRTLVASELSASRQLITAGQGCQGGVKHGSGRRFDGPPQGLGIIGRVNTVIVAVSVGSVVWVLAGLVIAVVVWKVGRRNAPRRYHARPLAPPEPGELRKVNVRYRCDVCGVELKLMLAPDDDPPRPSTVSRTWCWWRRCTTETCQVLPTSVENPVMNDTDVIPTVWTTCWKRCQTAGCRGDVVDAVNATWWPCTARRGCTPGRRSSASCCR